MNKVVALLGLAITVMMVMLGAAAPSIVDRARDAVFDSYQRLSPRPYDPQAPVHIIDIDEASLDLYGQWPWPRSYMAALTDILIAHDAAAIGYDVLFPEPDRTSPERIAESWTRFADGIPPVLPDLGLEPHDSRFARAISGRAVVLSVAGGNQGDPVAPKAGIAVTGSTPPLTRFPVAVGNLPELTEAAAGLGTISLGRSFDGITRTVPMVTQVGDVLMPALAPELLRVVQGAGGHILRTTEASGEVSGGTIAAVELRTGAIGFPVEADGRFRVHFAGQQPERTTPAALVLEAGVDMDPALYERVAGRIILVGSSAQGLFDIRTTPLDGQIAGVTLHAEVIEQILAGTFLTRPDWMFGLEMVLVVLAGLAMTLLLLRDQPIFGLVAALVLAAGVVGGGILAFEQAGILFSPVLPVLTVLAVYLPGTTFGLVAKERARRVIRQRFAYFLPPELISEIEDNPQAALTPEGAERDLSVMFVDMRGFSTVTEGMSPDRVVALVNTFLSNVAEALVDHGATIDKFMGDAVMAFWNAPIGRADHAAASLGAIVAVERAAQAANVTLEAENLPPISVGVGINTGPASVGLMGSRDRLSYTCIGDSVTLAARLEGLTRQYGVSNCVGSSTAAACPEGLRTVVLDLIAVKGFRNAVEVATVLPRDLPGLEAFAVTLQEARASYLGRDWSTAERGFATLSALDVPFCDTTLLARLYQERIRAFESAPPPPEWQGEAVATSKR